MKAPCFEIKGPPFRTMNAIVTQITGVIKYSVSDFAKEKGTIVNRKKLLVHVWLACKSWQ